MLNEYQKRDEKTIYVELKNEIFFDLAAVF